MGAVPDPAADRDALGPRCLLAGAQELLDLPDALADAAGADDDVA